MKNNDELKKSLNELIKQLEQSGDDSEQIVELKLKAQGVLESLSGEADNVNEELKRGSLKQAVASAVANILEPAAPRTFVFIKTLDDIDKKSLKEAVSLTRKCVEGPDCSSGDIIAVANTLPSKYFLEGMVFTKEGVFWEHRNHTNFIEYSDVEAAIVPQSDSTVGFGDDIMLIERYSNDEIAIPFNRTLYSDYRAIGDLLLELNKIAAEYE